MLKGILSVLIPYILTGSILLSLGAGIIYAFYVVIKEGPSDETFSSKRVRKSHDTSDFEEYQFWKQVNRKRGRR